jgi:hypothetical protein
LKAVPPNTEIECRLSAAGNVATEAPPKPKP